MCLRDRSYSYNEISSPADWLELDYYSEDEDMVIEHISLYSTATGEELTGFQQYTGAGTVSLYNSGRYPVSYTHLDVYKRQGRRRWGP